MAAPTLEEPMLSRLDRLDNILRQLEEIRGGNRTPKSSCASTPSSGTLNSDGQVSSIDYSPRSLEKHCRPIGDVIVETGVKGTLIERLIHVEDRVLKLCVQLESEIESEKKRIEEGRIQVVMTLPAPAAATPEKKRKKKGLKQLVKSCVSGKSKHES